MQYYISVQKGLFLMLFLCCGIYNYLVYLIWLMDSMIRTSIRCSTKSGRASFRTITPSTVVQLTWKVVQTSHIFASKPDFIQHVLARDRTSRVVYLDDDSDYYKQLERTSGDRVMYMNIGQKEQVYLDNKPNLSRDTTRHLLYEVTHHWILG